MALAELQLGSYSSTSNNIDSEHNPFLFAILLLQSLNLMKWSDVIAIKRSFPQEASDWQYSFLQIKLINYEWGEYLLKTWNQTKKWLLAWPWMCPGIQAGHSLSRLLLICKSLP